MKTTFKIHYLTQWGESLSVVLQDKKYPMEWHEGAVWTVTANVPAAALKDYWYVVMRDGVISRSEWSHHSSASAAVIEDVWHDCPIEGCPFVRKHTAELFDRPGFKGAGVAVPVFSLRSADDFGIGDFRDLRPLTDWAAATGLSIIQLLPVSDTTRKGQWKDSYPYSPISSFALHPLYLRLQEIGVKEDAAFKRAQKELNALPELDYPRVFKKKMALVRKAWEDHGAKDTASAAYKRFVKQNAYWLDEYAEFCARRDGNEADYWRWIQWHLDRQFADEVRYARSKGVYFKGDLPIGVSADSADAYFHPQLFNLDSSAGAPPDFFSAEGQNWGFPTYNWDEMAKDGYAWWKARLRKMSEYFDAFRIDHILGFFRIWEIPAEYSSGYMGHFNPAIPYRREEIEDAGLPIEGLFLPDPRNPGCFQPRILPESASLPQWQQERFGAIYNDFAQAARTAGRKRDAGLRRGPRNGARLRARSDGAREHPVAGDVQHGQGTPLAVPGRVRLQFARYGDAAHAVRRGARARYGAVGGTPCAVGPPVLRTHACDLPAAGLGGAGRPPAPQGLRKRAHQPAGRPQPPLAFPLPPRPGGAQGSHGAECRNHRNVERFQKV